MTDKPIDQWPNDDGKEAAKPAPAERPKQRERVKMSLSEQAAFLGLFCNKFIMRDGTRAGELMTRVTQDDMLRWETIHQTMMLMELHGADLLIRDKIARERRASFGRK